MSTRPTTCTNKALKVYNKCLIAGDGVDGIGAICSDNTTSQMDALFYSDWTLTDDASIGTTQTARFDYGYGDIDLRTIATLIKAQGFDGCISIEFEGREESVFAAQRSLDNVKRLFRD